MLSFLWQVFAIAYGSFATTKKEVRADEC